MSKDPYKNALTNIDSVSDKADKIEPSDNTDLATVSRGIYIGGSGNLTCILANMETPITFANVAAGSVLPLRIKRVMATDNTATGLVALL